MQTEMMWCFIRMLPGNLNESVTHPDDPKATRGDEAMKKSFSWRRRQRRMTEVQPRHVQTVKGGQKGHYRIVELVTAKYFFTPPNVITFSKNIRQVLFICTFALLQKIINTKFSLPPVWKYGNSYLKIPLLDPIWGFASFFYLLPW